MEHKLAIDLGTSNSVVAHWNESNGTSEVLHLPGLSGGAEDRSQFLVPSLLYVVDGQAGQVIIGQAVLDAGLDRLPGNRLFRCFKRGITSGLALEPRLIDGVPWTDRDAGRHFCRALIGALSFSPAEIEHLVVTVPVAAFDGYVTWLSAALGPDLGGRVRVVDESTAAAIGYAVTEPGAIVLVCDFGGGSLDLSLVRLPESRERSGSLLGRLRSRGDEPRTARILAKAGVNLGGSDVDQWLLAAVLARAGLSPSDLARGRAAVLAACERAKIALSAGETTSLHFAADDGTIHDLPWTRPELEDLLARQGLYTALRSAAARLMAAARRAGTYEEDVGHILMVGGVSLIPSVQRTLREHFRDRAVRVEKPFTAVAEGALRVAAGLGLADQLAHSYGLRCLDLATGRHIYDEIAAQGSRYPTPRPVEVLLGASHPGQRAVELIVGQIEAGAASMVEVQYEDGVAVFVAQAGGEAQSIVCPGAALAVPLEPPGVLGQQRLRAAFHVDDQRRLRVSVADLLTGKKLVRDAALLTLGQAAEPGDQGNGEGITGREPCLVSYQGPPRERLSIRRLVTMLDVLPPEAISLAAVAAALRSPDCTVRWSAAELLGRRGDREARRLAAEVLAGGTNPQRASVARHLHRFTWFSAELLLRQALADADPRVRESAVYGLSKVGTGEAFQLLEEVLPGEEDGVLLEAAWALENCRDPRAVPVLGIVLGARDPRVREKALESLGTTGVREGLAIARQALDDPHLDVQYAATLSLLELGGEDCLAEVACLIVSRQGQAREQVLRGLFHAANYLFLDLAHCAAAGPVLAALAVALEDSLPATRLAAAMPLVRMDHPRAAVLLQAAYDREPNVEIRERLLTVAVLLESRVGPALLRQALAGPDGPERRAAAELSTYISLGRPDAI